MEETSAEKAPIATASGIIIGSEHRAEDLRKGKQPEQALKTFRKMQQKDAVPNVFTYSAVIREMQRKDGVTVVITYSAVISLPEKGRL